MLMSHSERSIDAYIQYKVTVVTGRPDEERRAVLGARERVRRAGVLRGPRRRRPGLDLLPRHYDWKVPFDGRIVAVGGHLHGGAKDMWMSQPACDDRRILDNAPHFGMPDHIYYKARPILHEPGPFDTRYFMSRGHPRAQARSSGSTRDYDNSAPHPRVMAISHVYVTPDKSIPKGCPPLPADAVHVTKPGPFRAEPPEVSVPLNRVSRKGRTETFNARPGERQAGQVRHHRRPPRQQVQPGPHLGAGGRFGDVALRRRDPAQRPLRLRPAAGRQPDAQRRQDLHDDLPQPGHYELFCYLHPMTMHEVVEVTG